ncbi:hypothetical protein BU26DRAFT_548549 [Trematosphaeria pertusa]|uniref:Uncharacterized protein n=1 Tax=Trematosphaeria pertusa TaxID=390896 RepID=A0A6A6IME9_9PLEO|nr:uncharacterized protein BU26DRAFT_548549 [Trematosphaeria pertusa]KAF2251745.1 hypothetical protein BU26DRAFT_548549 [Trematosphaeria pertusa]
MSSPSAHIRLPGQRSVTFSDHRREHYRSCPPSPLPAFRINSEDHFVNSFHRQPVNKFHRHQKGAHRRPPSPYPLHDRNHSSRPICGDLGMDSPTHERGTCPYCHENHSYPLFPEHVMQMPVTERMKRWWKGKKNQVVDATVEAWYRTKDRLGKKG